MTLIIAYLLMTMMDAHWIWYPVVFVIWLIHLMWNEGYVTIKSKKP